MDGLEFKQNEREERERAEPFPLFPSFLFSFVRAWGNCAWPRPIFSISMRQIAIPAGPAKV
jgi:hypothetical protein